MSYTSQVRHLHKTLAPQVPIGVFVDALRPEAIGAADKTQFYAPERFSIQIAGSIGSAGGAIRLDVPVRANAQWLDTMKQRFASMIGLPVDVPLESMDFCTVTGRSISAVPVDQLRTLGKLNFFVKGKMIRLPAVPEIPIEYSLTKVKNLQSWVQDATAELPELIADELMGKNVLEINAAIRMDGPLHKMIEDHLRGDSQTNWNEFVRVHHMNAPVTMEEREAERALSMVSRQILIGFRDFVAAAKEPIGNYVASVEARRLERELKDRGEDAQHFAPILGESVLDRKQATKTKGFDMFRKLADDMLSTPVLQRSIIEILYNRALPVGDCTWYHYGKSTRKRELRMHGGHRVPPGQYRSTHDPKASEKRQREAEEARAAADEAREQANRANATAAEKRAAQLAEERATELARRVAEQGRKEQEEAFEKARAEEEALEKLRKEQAAGGGGGAAAADGETAEESSANVVPPTGMDDEIDRLIAADSVKKVSMDKVRSLIAKNVETITRPQLERLIKWKLPKLQDVTQAILVRLIERLYPTVANGTVAEMRQGILNEVAPINSKLNFLGREYSNLRLNWTVIANKSAAKRLINDNPRALTKDDWLYYFEHFGDTSILSGLNKDALAAAQDKLGVGDTVAQKKASLMDVLSQQFGIAIVSSDMDAHHPWNAQIHHTLEPAAGAYPSYYPLLNKKQDMSKDAHYSADLKQTYDAYHLFAGVPPSPVGVVIDPLASIECHGRPESEESDEEDDLRVQSSIGSAAAIPPRPPLKRLADNSVVERVKSHIVPVGSSNAVLPPRPPLKRFAQPGGGAKVGARMVPYSETIGDAAPIDDDYLGDDYGLPLSSDAFD